MSEPMRESKIRITPDKHFHKIFNPSHIAFTIFFFIEVVKITQFNTKDADMVIKLRYNIFSFLLIYNIFFLFLKYDNPFLQSIVIPSFYLFIFFVLIVYNNDIIREKDEI